MQKSETIGALAAALAKAQTAIDAAEKNKANPAFRSKYADLASIWDACRDALTANGLSVAQFAEDSEPGTLRLTTMLLHTSGEWIAGTMALPLAKQDPQGYGSACTYARRYGLAAMVGVCPDDDDGNAASGQQGHGGHQGRQEARPVQQQPRQPAQTRPQPAPDVPESRGDAGAQDGGENVGIVRAACTDLYRALGGDPNNGDACRRDFGTLLGREIAKWGDLKLGDWLRIREGLKKQGDDVAANLEPAPQGEPASGLWRS
jgi:hypothetical protein